MKRTEHGVILLVALIAILALAFAGMALVRAASIGVAIGGNLAARERAVLAASGALEHDVAALFETTAIDVVRDDATRAYFAARQTGEDARGVPAALQSLAAYPGEFGIIDAGEGHQARHVIERLCTQPGEATAATCTLSPPSPAAASGAPPPDEPPRVPYYRVTVRVDGPAGAATFVQAMLSLARPSHRLSWRVLDE